MCLFSSEFVRNGSCGPCFLGIEQSFYKCLTDMNILLEMRAHHRRHHHNHQQQPKSPQNKPVTAKAKATTPKPLVSQRPVSQRPVVGKISRLLSKIGCIRRELTPSSSCKNCLQPLFNCTQDCARVQLFDCLKCIKNVYRARNECSQCLVYAIDIVDYCSKIVRMYRRRRASLHL